MFLNNTFLPFPFKRGWIPEGEFLLDLAETCHQTFQFLQLWLCQEDCGAAAESKRYLKQWWLIFIKVTEHQEYLEQQVKSIVLCVVSE